MAEIEETTGIVRIPMNRYEDLIRAELERDALEAAIMGEAGYNVERVLTAIQRARERRMRRFVGIEPPEGNDAE